MLAPNQTPRMPVARGDIAPSLQLRRAPVLPMKLRQPGVRVLETHHSPRQLSLFPITLRPTRPVDGDTDFDAL